MIESRKKTWKFAAAVCVLGLAGLLIPAEHVYPVNDAVSLRKYLVSVYGLGYVLGITVCLLLFDIANKWGIPLYNDE